MDLGFKVIVPYSNSMMSNLKAEDSLCQKTPRLLRLQVARRPNPALTRLAFAA